MFNRAEEILADHFVGEAAENIPKAVRRIQAMGKKYGRKPVGIDPKTGAATNIESLTTPIEVPLKELRVVRSDALRDIRQLQSQAVPNGPQIRRLNELVDTIENEIFKGAEEGLEAMRVANAHYKKGMKVFGPVSYTHLRAHET